MAWEDSGMTLQSLRERPGQKASAKLSGGRNVALWLNRAGKVVVLDASCYHHGAPLVEGDLEDVIGPDGKPACVVVCPWHKYEIALDSGECFYTGFDTVTGEQKVKSKGVKQRPHDVMVEEGSGRILVRDSSLACPEGDEALRTPFCSSLPKVIASDSYSHKAPASMAMISGAGSAGVGLPGGIGGGLGVPLHSSLGLGLGAGGGYVRSGAIFSQMNSNASGSS